ncbi:MAG: hypothetical protein A2X59_03110 [Nitrospirae bacterium GWC2_42_7]|nr:MAG: hypothetical protein A2X59_03110 [Nitrospirae bacterium GWC2_42_7]
MIIFWKIYFWLLTILLIIGSITDGFSSYWDIVGLPLDICAFVGFFSYAYRKKIFNKIFWKSFLPIYIIWDVTYNLVIYPKYSEEPVEIIYILIGYIFIVPLYIALYRYAFKFLEGKEEIIEKDSPEIDPLDNVQYPSIPRRYLSTVIDSILVLSLFFIISFIFQEDSFYIKNIRIALVVSIVIIYEPLFTSKLCTLGQKLTSIRVRDAGSRQKISLVSAFVRSFVKLILGIISFFSIPFTRKKRGVHDFAASSVVIFNYQDKD